MKAGRAPLGFIRNPFVAVVVVTIVVAIVLWLIDGAIHHAGSARKAAKDFLRCAFDPPHTAWILTISLTIAMFGR